MKKINGYEFKQCRNEDKVIITLPKERNKAELTDSEIESLLWNVYALYEFGFKEFGK